MKYWSMKAVACMVFLCVFITSFPVTATEFSAKEGEYIGWGVVIKTEPGFNSSTRYWRTYPKYPDSMGSIVYPGDIIAQQKVETYFGKIIYSSLCAQKAHIVVNRSYYRHSYQFDLIVLGIGEEAIIGPLSPKNKIFGSTIVIKLIGIEKNGKINLQISQM